MSDEAVKVEDPKPIKLFGRDTEVTKQAGEEHKDLPLWTGSRFPFQGSVNELTAEEASRHDGRKYKGRFRIIEGTAGVGAMMSVLFGGGGHGPLAEYVANDPQVVADALTKDAEALLVEMLEWSIDARTRQELSEKDTFDETVDSFKVWGLKFERDDQQPSDHLRLAYYKGRVEENGPCFEDDWSIVLRTGVRNGERWWRAKPWAEGGEPDGEFLGFDPEMAVGLSLAWIRDRGGMPGQDLDKEVSDRIWPKYGTSEPTG